MKSIMPHGKLHDDLGIYAHIDLKAVVDYAGGIDQFREYVSLTVVRNPWERLVSLYYYWSRTDPKHTTVYNNFSDWLIEGVGGGKYQNILISQSNFYHYDNIFVTHVIKYDTMTSDIIDLIRKLLDIDVSVPRINYNVYPSSLSSYREMYDGKTRKFVEKEAAEDIEMFDFEF